MIEWIRIYNESVPAEKKVQFLGYDLQVNDAAAFEISRYFKKVSPRDSNKTDSLLHAILESPTIFSGDTTIRQLIPPVEDMILEMVLEQGRYMQLSSSESYSSCLQKLRILHQYLLSYSYNAFAGEVDINYRDYYMAENIFYLFSTLPENPKMVVWAHNGHIQHNRLDPDVINTYFMGHYLQELFGDKYYALGFDFGQGSFQSRNLDLDEPKLDVFTMEEAPENSLAYYCRKLKTDIAFFDFSVSEQSPLIQEWLYEREIGMYSMGSSFSAAWPISSYVIMNNIGENYDGLLFIRNTNAAKPLESITIDRYRF